jgi:hypothetical protein
MPDAAAARHGPGRRLWFLRHNFAHARPTIICLCTPTAQGGVRFATFAAPAAKQSPGVCEVAAGTGCARATKRASPRLRKEGVATRDDSGTGGVPL